MRRGVPGCGASVMEGITCCHVPWMAKSLYLDCSRLHSSENPFSHDVQLSCLHALYLLCKLSSRTAHFRRSFPSLPFNLGRLSHHLAAATRPRPAPSILQTSQLPQMDNAFGNFDLLTKFHIQSTHTVVSKWRSRKTGLSIVHLDYDGACWHDSRMSWT